MGAKLSPSKVMEVPGPGAYTATMSHKESVKNGKFGNDKRGDMAKAGADKLPGPGEHAPDYRALKTASPRFGFGS